MIVVQKFGGTCLDTREKRNLVCQRIQDALKRGYRVLAVVSAMGRKGEPYATDTLISLAEDIHPNIAARELDLLISCGEIISAVLMVQELQSRGIPSMALSGGQAGILTDTNFGDARILAVDTTHVRRHLDEGKVVVVAGFQGRAESGDITTLGRGGSDTTATALGGALDAAYVEIYTDVDGIMTADPRMVEEARTIPVATYDEVVHLAWEGAKVIHPRAVEIARRAQVPVWVRSLSQDSKKTLITNGEDKENPWLHLRNGDEVTGVTYRAGMALISVGFAEEETMEMGRKVFSSLKEISLDFITFFPGKVSLIVPEERVSEVTGKLAQTGVSWTVKTSVAKVTVVGYGMHGKPGVMETVVRALAAENLRVLASSDSNITISCLIDGDDLKRAVKALHSAFIGPGRITGG